MAISMQSLYLVISSKTCCCHHSGHSGSIFVCLTYVLRNYWSLSNRHVTHGAQHHANIIQSFRWTITQLAKKKPKETFRMITRGIRYSQKLQGFTFNDLYSLTTAVETLINQLKQSVLLQNQTLSLLKDWMITHVCNILIKTSRWVYHIVVVYNSKQIYDLMAIDWNDSVSESCQGQQ